MDQQYDEAKIDKMVTDMKKNIGGVVKDLMPEGHRPCSGAPLKRAKGTIY